LIELEGLSIAIDEESEEVEQFRFIETIVRLILNSATDLLDELEKVGFIEQHSLVVVIHLLEEVDAANVLLEVVADHRNVRNKTGLDVLEVPDETHQELITEMKQF
jgi:hypothetical protein